MHMTTVRMTPGSFIIGVLVVATLLFVFLPSAPIDSSSTRSDGQWKEILTEEQYRITRQAGTEPSHSNDEYTYMYKEQSGTFYDVTGEQALFHTDDQYDSKTGWPSFTKPISEDALISRTDYKIGFPRTELLSSKYGHHLGHLFKDGPEPMGLRYCINAAALKFVPDES